MDAGRRAIDQPDVVLVDGVGQWLFNRGQAADGEWYVQVVVSAARQFRGLGREEVQRRVIVELRNLFPAGREAQLRRLAQVRASRNQAAVDEALAAMTKCAETGEGNMLELSIDAARKRATLGEISSALEKVWGRYHAEIRSGVLRPLAVAGLW